MTGGPADLSHRRVRTARAVAASSLATLVALASHLAGGGAMPPLVLVATICVLSWLPAVLLIGRRLSLLRQGLVIGLSECALHLLFSLGAASAGGSIPVPATPMGPMPGMPAADAAAMPAMPMPVPGMWLAHAAAALLTLLAWNRGEGAFWALARLAWRLSAAVVPRLLGGGPWSGGPVLLLLMRAAPSFHIARVLEVRARRGPPAGVLQL